jgi:sensor c-di-GMP phosphodiesterase-like protein
MNVYEQNRAKLPPNELAAQAGRWVALTLDGSRVLASAPTLAELEEQLGAAGVDPQQVAFERIEREDSQLGGGQFF